MDMMDGLAGTLAGIQEDAPQALKMTGGFVLGVSLGAIVNNFVSNIGVTTDDKGVRSVKGKDGAPVVLSDNYEEQDKVLPVPHWVGPLVPVAVGLGLFAMKRGEYPVLAGANGIGMVAYGLARLVKNFANRADQKDPKSWGATVNKYLPFGATDTYESPLLAGLGYGPGNIDRYLAQGMNGLGYGPYDRSPGAPVMVERLASAPTEFQEVRLAAAPMTATALNGLSATLM